MKAFLVILIFTVSSCQFISQRGPSSSNSKIDIVFDLDYTLISLVDESYRGKKNVIAVGDELYRVHDWARELVTSLHQNPRYRVSFFSGGPEARNLSVLNQIKLLDGSKKSFAQVAHKLLHRDDLLNIDPPASIVNPSPADRWKKDLRKINKNLDQVIIFEDDARHALNPRQRRSNLWMGMSYLHFDTKKQLLNAQENMELQKFVPPSINEWQLQRNKLALSFGILEEAVDELDSKGGRLPVIVQKKLSNAQLSSNILNAEGKRYFLEGSYGLKKFGPKAARVPLDFQCTDLINSFFRQLAL